MQQQMPLPGACPPHGQPAPSHLVPACPPSPPLYAFQVAQQAEEVRGALGERDEAAKRLLAQAEELVRQRSELQNQQRELFQREAELGV